MRIAIISDIHGNLEALTSIFEDIDSQNINEVVCLGDVIGYGPNPNECIKIVRDRCPIVIQGNHDAAALDSELMNNFNSNAKAAMEWTKKILTEESYEFLQSLPLRIISEDKTYVHATPFEPKRWYYITSLEEAAFNFQYFQTKFCFVGHTHIPVIIMIGLNNRIKVVQEQQFHYGAHKDSQFLINVGSSGQPRDRNPKVSYGILDSEQETFEFRRLDYDMESCQKKMIAANFPEFLYTRLAEGK